MSKKKDKVKVSFLGNASKSVTGSMYLVETSTKKILLECGMTQSSNQLDDFKENSKSFPFKPKSIDYVFLNHSHIDHSGLIPKLVHDGFNGKIISTDIAKALMKPMGLDSAKIIRKDSDYLTKKYGKSVSPYYSEEDVYGMIDLTETYRFGEIHKLDEEISFKFLKNSHIIGAFQLELFIKNASGHIDKILYTSDLGSPQTKNHYVSDLEKCKKTTIVISESTYGGSAKGIKPNREKDLEKIQVAVDEICNVKKGRILIPVFALSRSQQILTDLFLLYGGDENFKIPVIVDSPLIWEINKVYKSVLEGENLELFEKACNWKNVRFIKDYKESQLCVIDKSPKIVLSSSGFLQKGRVVNYLGEYIGNYNDGVIICGYCPPNSIGGKIKSGQKTITIDKVSRKNKCGIMMLGSYSSHIQQKELLNYLKSINTDKIYLVHGEEKGKLEFKKLLEGEISKMNKTTKVIATIKGMTATV